MNCLARGALLLVLLTGFSLAANSQNQMYWSSLKPDKASTPVKILLLNQQLDYYPLERNGEILLSLQGPTTLRVHSRLEYTGGSSEEKRYFVRYAREDGKEGNFLRNTTPDKAPAILEQPKTVLGSARNLYLKVPPGKHTYRFFLGDKDYYKLYVRFYERATALAPPSENINFEPYDYTSLVPIAVKEKESEYYRVGRVDSVRLVIIGPTTLQVFSRLEFDSTMVTDQKYRLKVFEDKSEKQVFDLTSRPSDLAQYREASSLMAGQAAKVYVEVPKGKHEYYFQVIDKGRSALLRFSIPRKALKNNL
jgi:hypothetical protein